MRTVTVIAKGKNACQIMQKQLNDFLGDRVIVEGYFLEGKMKPSIGRDLVVASSAQVMQLAAEYLNPTCPRVIALRSINYQEIDPLFNLAPGTKCLLVNNTLSSAEETISLLKAIGMDHIEYFPCAPEMDDYPKLKTAITPGEVEIVPDHVETIIDIKNRNIDFVTLVEILQNLSLLDEKANLLSARYVSSIIDLIKKNKQMAVLNSQIKNQLETIINSVRDGIVALDADQNIAVFNAIAEELLGCSRDEVLGKRLTDKHIRKDISNCLKELDKRSESFVKINGRQLVFNTSPIIKDGQETGRVFTLNDVSEIQRLEEEHRRKLISRENCARYHFSHILGDSSVLENTKMLAEKVARSDSPVLIYGETGTGKELFAQSIHNFSTRKNGPFIAVNFAALSESLLESELFGYEEGAFTGARKGGMVGLFQQAHKGTIFLDEIGDAPVPFQVKLLRVLQEKQVRPISGSRVIPIDIRVIVATNKNLKALVGEGLFRQDLYYRLNVLPIRLPPLRERKQDILTLARHFYLDYFKGSPLIPPEDYFASVEGAFTAYDWPGNVRELWNVVEYLANICAHRPPDEGILPEEMKVGGHDRRKPEMPGERSQPPAAGSARFVASARRILALVAAANSAGRPAGRRSLAEEGRLSEGVVRGLVKELAAQGLLTVGRGRRGLYLSAKGMEYLRDHGG